jgi:hypothetical protein
MRQQLDHGEVSLVIRATPTALYDLVADITRTPQFSPSVVRAEWVGGAPAPAVGAGFRARSSPRRGYALSNKPVTTVADPGHELHSAGPCHSPEPFNGATNSPRKTV